MGKRIVVLGLAFLVCGCGGPRHTIFKLRADFSGLPSSKLAGNTLASRTKRVLDQRLLALPHGEEASVHFGKDGEIKIEASPDISVDQYEHALTANPKLEFYDARSVTTGAGQKRLYDVGKQSKYQGAPAYTFIKRDGAEIKPNSGDYKRMIATWGKPVLSSDDLWRVSAEPYNDGYIPELDFTADGAKKIEAWCRRNQYTGAQLATVMDGVVISIAPLKSGTILRDSAVIQGEFDNAYVMQLKDLLSGGALPVPLKVESAEKR